MGKRGRKKVENVAREPNGRICRSSSDPADRVALEARARHLGLIVNNDTKYTALVDAVKDQRLSTFIGRLGKLGERRPADGISKAQEDAANDYLALYQRFQRAVKAPGALYDPGLVFIPDDTEGSEAYRKWCDATIDRFEAAKRALQDKQNYSRGNILAAVDLCVIRDEEHWHLVGSLREGLNALAHFFRT